MIVRQICYYNESDVYQALNNPIGLKANDLINGYILTDATYNEIQVKAFPGTKLEINGQKIVIGDIGIYNILYEEQVDILSIKVDLESIKRIQQFEDAFLIITAMRNS